MKGPLRIGPRKEASSRRGEFFIDSIISTSAIDATRCDKVPAGSSLWLSNRGRPGARRLFTSVTSQV